MYTENFFPKIKNNRKIVLLNGTHSTLFLSPNKCYSTVRASLDLQRVEGRLDGGAEAVEDWQTGIAQVLVAAHGRRGRGRGQMAHHRRGTEIPGTGRGARNDRGDLRVGEGERGPARGQGERGTVREEADHRVGGTHRQGSGGAGPVRTRAHAHRRTQRHRVLHLVLVVATVVLQTRRATDHVVLRHGHGCGWWRRVVAHLLLVVHKVAAGSVGTVAGAVEGAAQLGLVARVALQIAQLMVTVRELALVAVLALARLLEGPAQLGLVTVIRRGNSKRVL